MIYIYIYIYINQCDSDPEKFFKNHFFIANNVDIITEGNLPPGKEAFGVPNQIVLTPPRGKTWKTQPSKTTNNGFKSLFKMDGGSLILLPVALTYLYKGAQQRLHNFRNRRSISK